MGSRKNRFGEAVLTCTHDLCFGVEILKNIENLPTQFLTFRSTAEKNLCILHGCVFVMVKPDLCCLIFYLMNV